QEVRQLPQKQDPEQRGDGRPETAPSGRPPADDRDGARHRADQRVERRLALKWRVEQDVAGERQCGEAGGEQVDGERQVGDAANGSGIMKTTRSRHRSNFRCMKNSATSSAFTIARNSRHRIFTTWEIGISKANSTSAPVRMNRYSQISM